MVDDGAGEDAWWIRKWLEADFFEDYFTCVVPMLLAAAETNCTGSFGSAGSEGTVVGCFDDVLVNEERIGRMLD